jgi:glycosyltransferase involved in cell wall biosynthesis
MPKVSVIIPCYNLGAYLDEAVDSVLAQTFRDFEIIIVNDGSTDESTMNLLANYNKPKTRVLHQENQGVSSARNNGIRISSGEYVCCLDADDKYHPEFLEKTVKVLDEDGAHQYGFVTTWFYAFGEKDAIWDTLDFDPWREAVSNGIHVASLFRRECWEKRGGYSVSLAGYEDWDFWISIVAMGYEWANIKEPLFSYRVRANSKVNRDKQNRITLYRQIIRNNKDFYTSNCEDILAKFMERLSQTEVELSAIRQSLTWRLATKAYRMLNALLPSRLKK